MRIPSRTLGSWIVAVACALLLTACETTTESSSSSDAGTTQSTDGGFVAPIEPADSPSSSSMMEVELQPVYFGYDRSELTSEARDTLQKNATALGSAKGMTTVTGHTDKRGTFEYNIALGDRRANVVKKYLVALGLSASQIKTSSAGEASPAVMGADESAYRWNRRAVLSQ